MFHIGTYFVFIFTPIRIVLGIALGITMGCLMGYFLTYYFMFKSNSINSGSEEESKYSDLEDGLLDSGENIGQYGKRRRIRERKHVIGVGILVGTFVAFLAYFVLFLYLAYSQ